MVKRTDCDALVRARIGVPKEKESPELTASISVRCEFDSCQLPKKKKFWLFNYWFLSISYFVRLSFSERALEVKTFELFLCHR
jgi:hypothetical protein